MGDPTNRNDPEYANSPNYVWSGGRWQYVSNPTTANNPAAAPQGSVRGESLGTPGGWADVFGGLAGRIGGTPFGGKNSTVVDASIPNAQAWQALAQQNAGRQQATNPYNAAVADQSRAGQMALMEQMRAQMNGPSLAGMQGQRALAQSGQQALMQGGRAGMLNAQGAGAGLAGDVGQARLAEVMRAQGGIGGVAGNLRSADLRSAEAQAQSGLRAQGIQDQRAQFYAGLGSGMQTAQDRVALENFKLNERLKQAGAKSNAQGVSDYVGVLGSLFGMGGGIK